MNSWGRSLKGSWNQATPGQKRAWGLWLLVLILLTVKCITAPLERTVAGNYFMAGQQWLAGESIYSHGHGYLYLPEFAFLYSWLTPLPVWLSELAGRLVQMFLLLWGLLQFCQFMERQGEKSAFPWMTLVIVLIGFSSFRNGQTNIGLIGLTLLSVMALLHERWWQAGVFMTLGLIFKPTFIVFYLLAGALFRPMYWRLPIGLLLAFWIPVLFSHFDYVWAQHVAFVENLLVTVDIGVKKAAWASFFGIFPQVFGFYIPDLLQHGVRLVLAPVTLLLAWRVKQTSDPQTLAFYLYALPVCYLMLFNPRNENNDFALMAPLLGYWLAVAINRAHGKALVWLISLLIVGTLFSYDLSKLITPEYNAWMAPLMATVFSAFILIRLFRNRPVH